VSGGAAGIAWTLPAPGVLSSRVVHFAELTPPEQRVLGCLIEKRWTTPDQYPLSLNALRLASNQSTNRDPVTDYDEHTVREAAQRLCKYGLARLASGQGSRAIKYRHLAEEALGLGREELAILCVLLLRGAQTPGEIKSRSERMARVGSLDDVERILDTLSQRGYARRLDRRPGQKEDRFEQLLGGAAGLDGSGSTAASMTARVGPQAAAPLVSSSSFAATGGSNPAAGFHDRRAGVADRPAGVADRPAGVADRTAGVADRPAGVADRPADLADRAADLAVRVAALEAEVASLRAELAELRDRASVS
jgi:uncharacterized protein YceH (UPF0502 family)